MQHSMLGQKIILLRSIFDFVHDDLMVTDVSDSHLNTKSDNSLNDLQNILGWSNRRM